MRETMNVVMSEEKKYGDKSAFYHRNCAECVLITANEVYELGLSKDAIAMMGSFGGGLHTENNCGALVAGAAALGAILKEEMPSKNETLIAAVKEWVEKFEEKMCGIDCDQIKENNPKVITGCGEVKLDSAELLQEIIEKYKN